MHGRRRRKNRSDDDGEWGGGGLGGAEGEQEGKAGGKDGRARGVAVLGAKYSFLFSLSLSKNTIIPYFIKQFQRRSLYNIEK